MGGTDGIRSGWHGWLDAWRGLTDNPLYVHFRRVVERRRRKTSWLSQNLLVVIGLAAGIILAWCYIDFVLFTTTASQLGLANYLGAGLITIGPPFVLWLAQGIYTAVYDGMSLLGVQGRRQHYLAIDDLTAIGLLDDREILVAAFRLLVPPLWWRSVAFAAMLVAAKTMITLEMDLATSSQTFGMWLLNQGSTAILLGLDGYSCFDCVKLAWMFIPGWERGLLIGLADLPTVALCGALASVALVLLMVALGRGVVVGWAGAAAGILNATAQVLFIYPGVFIHETAMMSLPNAYRLAPAGTPAYWGNHLSPQATSAVLLLSIPLNFCILIGLLALGLVRARSWPRLRASLASILPVVVVAVAVAAVAVSITTGAYSPYGNEAVMDVVTALLAQFDLTYSSFMVGNVIAGLVPSEYMFGLPQGWLVHWTDWLRTPALIIGQVGLIAMLAHFARDAIRLRRRESHS